MFSGFSVVLLKCVCYRALDQPYRYVCPSQGWHGVFPLQHGLAAQRRTALHWLLRERPAGHGELTPTAEADLTLSLLYVSKALFHPVLDALLSLETPTPRCNGQRCLDSYSWWLAQ